MRYKESTLRKLEAQATKLKTLQRAIEQNQFTGRQAIEFIEFIIKDINSIVERLELEPNE